MNKTKQNVVFKNHIDAFYTEAHHKPPDNM